MKKVSFTIFNDVYYIPKETDVTLWWSEEDKLNAVKSIKKEINYLLKLHPNMDKKIIKYMLFQRTKIIYDANFFIDNEKIY